MKYFYPIYKMKLKPWIKWWILKRLGGGQSSLKAVTLSSGTLTKVDKSKALSIKEYYGNTVQDGTPTPESPVEVQTISGNITFTINGGDYKLDLKGKNLFNDILRQGTTIYNTGVWSASNSRITSTDWIKNVKAGTYTISAKTSMAKTLRVSMVTFNANGVFYNIPDVSGQWKTMPFTFTIPIDMQLKCNICYTDNSNITPSEVIEVQLESGNVETEYSPSNPIELCKIGDYQDRIYKENDKWYIEKNIGKVVLNGSENWEFVATYTNTSRFKLRNFNDIKQNSTELLVMSNYFQGQTTNNRTLDVIGVVPYSTEIYIRTDTSISTVDAFKTWLGTNNTTLYYVLATPTTETITNTNLISQLNALYEFYVNSSTVTISNNSEITLEVLLEYYGR